MYSLTISIYICIKIRSTCEEDILKKINWGFHDFTLAEERCEIKSDI